MADIELRRGNTGKYRIALYTTTGSTKTLVPWGDLVNPKAMLRKRGVARNLAIELGIEDEVDNPTTWTAKVEFTAGTTDTPGHYWLEVDATVNAEMKTFPSGRTHITVQILPDVGAA